MRLIRTLLVLSGAGFLLPSPPETAGPQGPVAETEQVSTFEMLASASAAASDVAGFCARQPGVCETATFVAARLEAKAKYSVKLIYEWASDATSDPALPQGTQEVIKFDMMKTGTVQLAKAEVQPPTSQSTLTIEDILPEWRGPAKQRAKKQG